VMAPRLKNSRVAFPRAQVESALTAWWDQRTGSALARRRPREECRRLGGTVFDIQPAISFIETVTAMLQLEALLGFDLGKNAIPRGGYNSREQFVQDLTARLETEYAKHYGLTGALGSTSGKRGRARD
jgi:hypothetical protein